MLVEIMLDILRAFTDTCNNWTHICINIAGPSFKQYAMLQGLFPISSIMACSISITKRVTQHAFEPKHGACQIKINTLVVGCPHVFNLKLSQKLSAREARACF